MNEDFAAELIRRGEARGDYSQEKPANAVDDIELRDGDSGDIGTEDDVRFEGFNTGEKYHDGRTDAHPNADAAQQLTQDTLDDGGYVEVGEERGAYDRFMSKVKDKHGRNIARDMVQSGAAAPTRSVESSQDEMTGIARQALGYDRTNNEAMNAVGEQNREMNDEFTPWEKGTLEGEVYDRRGTFEKAFDRGTDETKAALGGALNFIGESLGNEEWAAEGRAAARRHGVDAAMNKREFGSYQDVDSLEDAMDYVVETVGETAPGLLVDAVATAGTVAAGAATGGAGAAVGAGLMGAMRATASRALLKGAKAGLYAGPAASGFVQSSGAMQNRLDDNVGEGEHTAESLASGVAGAATNALPFLAVMGRSLKATGLSDEAAKPVLDALAKPSVAKRLKDVGLTTGTGMLAEGSTELAQTVIDETIATEMGGDEWSIETRDMVDAGIRAVIGGGIMGAGVSATGNAVGVMREYNEARRGADAEGQAIDEDGWLADEEVDEEQSVGADGEVITAPTIDEDLTKSIDRAAKQTFGKRGKSKTARNKAYEDESQSMQVVGQGQFDASTYKDVPNLKNTRYKELKGILEPKGVPVDLKTVGNLIDQGQLTEAELASYAADNHYGRNTPVSGGFNRERGDEAMRQALDHVVGLSREGRINMTDKQRDRLAEAEDTGTDVAIRGALADISPKIVDSVYKHANEFDGRAMFRDYAKIKADKTKQKLRIKREAKPVESTKENAKKPVIPEGEAPEEKTKKVRGDAPTWMKEGREPTKAELKGSIKSVEDADKKLSLRVKSAIRTHGKKGPVAKAVFSVVNAKDRAGMAAVAKRYNFEGVGNLAADKRALVSRIANTRHTPDGKPNIEDTEGLRSIAQQVIGERKAEPSNRPTTVGGKLDYIAKELGTRDASDGQVNQLLKGREEYEKAAKAKPSELFNPADLTPELRKAIASRNTYKKNGNDDVVKQIDALQAKIDNYELRQAYPKAVDSLFNEVENSVVARERGYKDDLRHEGASVDEDGVERSVGDTQGGVHIPAPDRDIAFNYTKRTEFLEHAYLSLKKIKNINGKNLLSFMQEMAAPTDEEVGTGLKLKRGRATSSTADKLRGQEYGLGLTGDISESDKIKPAFTHGLEEKRPETRHLNARTVDRIRKLIDEGNNEDIKDYLTQINVIRDDFVDGISADENSDDKLHTIVRTSLGRGSAVREATPSRRSTKGLVVRNNDTDKHVMVDMDAVTRWALRENDVDFDDKDASAEFISELSSAVLTGISALQNLRLADNTSPAYSFDVNTIGDDVVVYRMPGDKLASVTMGAIRSSAYYKGRKRKPSKREKDMAITDISEGDVGNVYRDAVEVEDFENSVLEYVERGDITEAEGDRLIEEAKHTIFDKEFEQGAKEGGELTVKTTRVEDEFENRDTATLFGSRDALHKLDRKTVEEREAKARKQTAKALERDVKEAKAKVDQLKSDKTNREAKSLADVNASYERSLTKRIKQIDDQIDKIMVEQIRAGGIKGYTIGQLESVKARLIKRQQKAAEEKGVHFKYAAVPSFDKETGLHGDTVLTLVSRGEEIRGFTAADIRNEQRKGIEAPTDMLNALAREHKKRNKELFDGSPDLMAELRQVQHELARVRRETDSVASEPAREEAMKRLHEQRIENAEHELMAAEAAHKRMTETLADGGRDTPKGRKITAQRKIVKAIKRRRGAVKEPIHRLLEMTKTRLKRIHPEAAARSDEYTAMRRNDTEYFASRIGKDIGDAQAVQKGYEDSLNKVDSPERKRYEAFLGDMAVNVKKSDPTYQPVTAKTHLDLHAVERNREGFLSILRESGVDTPESILESILEGNGYPEFAIRPELTNAPRSGRKVLDNAYEKLKAGGFVDTDAPRHLIRMINSSMSWAAWNATHGGMKNGKWDANTVFHRIESEVHPSNRQSFSKLYQGVTGRLGIDMSPKMRMLNSAALAFQSATVLWFSGIASVPEVAATYARMRGDANGMLDDIKSVITSNGRGELTKVARDFDIITDDAIEHSLQEMYNMNDMTMGRVSQKIQATVFRLNGQNYVTKMTRAIATKAAERYLVRAVEDGAAGEVRLAELGITRNDVQSYSRSRDLRSKAGRRYRDAVHKFVNEAVTNPRSTQLPMVANDPRFLLVTTLKKFFYGFYDNVHKALAKDFTEKRATGGNPLAAIGVTAAVALPMALLAETLREAIRYPFGRPDWQGERDMYDWGGSVLGATGALGPLTMAESVYRGTSFGDHPIVAAAGPTAQFAADVATLDVSASRVVPLANQIPWLAKPINDGVNNLIE